MPAVRASLSVRARFLGRGGRFLGGEVMATLAELEAKYKESFPGECPFCGSGDQDGDSWDYDGESVWQIVTCVGCGASWVEWYGASGAHSFSKGGGS